MLYQQLMLGFSPNDITGMGNQAIGYYGELLAASLLQTAGYLISLTHVGEMRGDLIAIDPVTGEKVIVEVKTARRGRDGKWRATLYKRGHASHKHADFVVLLALLKGGDPVPFVIPTRALTTSQIRITSHPQDYAGRYAQYRVKPDQIRLGGAL